MFKASIKNLQNEIGWYALFKEKEEAESWAIVQMERVGRLKLPLDQVVEDISLELELQKQKKEAKEYLSSSDWYVIRFMDSGVEIPSDVKLKREEARKLL